MAILIAGGAGYICSHMVVGLLKNNHDVVMLDGYKIRLLM